MSSSLKAKLVVPAALAVALVGGCSDDEDEVPEVCQPETVAPLGDCKTCVTTDGREICFGTPGDLHCVGEPENGSCGTVA
jgi:hypothetical protein